MKLDASNRHSDGYFLDVKPIGMILYKADRV